jgi:hypothetical protein
MLHTDCRCKPASSVARLVAFLALIQILLGALSCPVAAESHRHSTGRGTLALGSGRGDGASARHTTWQPCLPAAMHHHPALAPAGHDPHVSVPPHSLHPVPPCTHQVSRAGPPPGGQRCLARARACPGNEAPEHPAATGPSPSTVCALSLTPSACRRVAGAQGCVARRRHRPYQPGRGWEAARPRGARCDESA